MQGNFHPLHYGHFDLPNQAHGDDFKFATDKSQDFSNKGNYFFVHSENSTNPVAIDVTKALSFQKIYLVEYAIHGVPVTGDIPNFTHYDIAFNNVSNWTCQNWIHSGTQSSQKIPLLFDVGDVTHRVLNPPRLIADIAVHDLKKFHLVVTDPTNNYATYGKIALLFYCCH